MDDYISRQAAIDEIARWIGYIDEDMILRIQTGLKKVPSAQPERKKGEWIWWGNHHICSECDEWALTRWDEDKCDEVDILTDFCPNCGARMEEQE